MVCQKCGAELREGAVFCHNCGEKATAGDVLQTAEADQPAPAADGKNRSGESYGEEIKPYYREEFERIASGQKPKFNWAAFFLNGWIHLYNGCVRIFCRTFLPLLLVLLAAMLIGIAGLWKAEPVWIVVALCLSIVFGIGGVVLNILNGINFNKWYYQDVVDNPGKKRSRKGFWILLVCEAAAVAVPQVLFLRMLAEPVHGDYAAGWSDDRLYGEEYSYGDTIADEAAGAEDDAVNGMAPGASEETDEVPEIGAVAVDEASVDAALQILVDWFQRHPLMHDIKVESMEEALDAGDGTIYLLYLLYIEGEEYGFFGVNPDAGDVVMKLLPDSQGDLIEIHVPMDQWYLESYWGWTDDSGYHSELYTDDIYEVYNGEGALILEYHPSNDSYAICDYDGRSFLEYDDGTAASEVKIADFAGTYGYSATFEIEGTSVEDYYSLEIGAWDGYCFSITESWRGNEIIHDEYACPYSLVVDTLTFGAFGLADEGGTGYGMHTLTYLPAEYSPLGQDVIYLDGDETMPFVRE